MLIIQMRYITTAVLTLLYQLAICQSTSLKKLAKESKSSCVKIITDKGHGTGFFVEDNIIATCLHVVAQYIPDGQGHIQVNILPNLRAVTEAGQTVTLTCLSVPTSQSPEPFNYDFALLKVNEPVQQKTIISIESNPIIDVTDNVVLTGYPLDTPFMLTHLGVISGFNQDKSIISVDASVSKGNSGGALVNSQGNVIGIISLRLGGISAALESYLVDIDNSKKVGSVSFAGVNPLDVAKNTINVLDQNISTGVGFARNIRFLRDYARKYNIPIRLK